MPPAQKQLTAVEVIDMFKMLKLPVTDDQQKIEAAEKKHSDYYLRMTNHTDPQKRHQGKQWFKTATRIKDRRDELLQVVRDNFVQGADTMLEAALASNTLRLTGELLARLEEFSRKQCNCDEPLGRAMVSGYLQDRGLELEDALVIPHLVDDLLASAGDGEIRLTWSLPARGCDEVIVLRHDILDRADSSRQGFKLKRGRFSSYVDRDITAGQPYRYEVQSVQTGVVSQGGSSVECVALGDVTDLSTRWAGDHVELSWRKPSDRCEVFVLRARGSLPKLHPGNPEPIPVNGDTVYRGTDAVFVDHDVAPGHEYHYLVVCYFGRGSFTSGVGLRYRAPIPPPAVKSVTARCHDGAVQISWGSVAPNRDIEYLVVRRDGSLAAPHPEDGKLVATTRKTSHFNKAVLPGRQYTYTVFARADGAVGEGRSSVPVDVLQEVTGLEARLGDGTVELHWQTPSNVLRVVVCRNLTSPADHTDGQAVSIISPGVALDREPPDRQTHYLVCCVYRPARTEVVSPGVRVSATPVKMPDPLLALSVESDGPSVVCTWQPPAFGQVVVLRSEGPCRHQPGFVTTVRKMKGMGELLAGRAGLVRDDQPRQARSHYTAFTVAGDHAVVGPSQRCVAIPDATGLAGVATMTGVVLRWDWPEDCTAVTVSRCLDHPPTGPTDPQAVHVPVALATYLMAGERYVDVVHEGEGTIHYAVFAQVTTTSGTFHAHGVMAGSRASIQWAPWLTLEYSLTTPSSRPHKGMALRLRWSLDGAFPEFAGFTLRAAQDRPPTNPSDGVELFRWTPQPGQMEGEHEEMVSLDAVRRQRWSRFFVKAMLCDPSQLERAMVIHPNTCKAFLSSGKLMSREMGRILPYSHKAPRSVTCPNCFVEFPVGKLLFSSFDKDDDRRLQGKHSIWDRMRGRPPAPPVTEGRERLTRRICPNPECGKVLPYSAGTIKSLIIGIIGAKFSGKSHYIASLVNRLENQVSVDLQATLMSASDQTESRYKAEFHDPLFKHSFELPVTVGTPAPLIYDLVFSGALWEEQRDRAVTLALYDTAGENFNDADTVRRMIQYLRVASGIIFLVDPLQSPIVRDQIPPNTTLPNLDKMADPGAIIARVLGELERENVVAHDGPLPTPVAVALTKSDVLRDNGLLPPGRLWSTDTRHSGSFDAAMHEDIAGMMGEQLLEWSPRAYQTITQRFSSNAVFGVSATGCASDKNTRRYKFVNPWRVEDPLLWLLAELGVIPKKNQMHGH